MDLITAASEAFRLAVENSPEASLDYRVLEVTGSEATLRRFDIRHHARIEIYATLAGQSLRQATQRIQQAALRLDESRGAAIDAWNSLCDANRGDALASYRMARYQPWLEEYAAAALLSPEEAGGWLTRNHLPVCEHG